MNSINVLRIAVIWESLACLQSKIEQCTPLDPTNQFHVLKLADATEKALAHRNFLPDKNRLLFKLPNEKRTG